MPHTPLSHGHWSRKVMLLQERVARQRHFVLTRAKTLTANQITLGERNGSLATPSKESISASVVCALAHRLQQ